MLEFMFDHLRVFVLWLVGSAIYAASAQFS